MDIVALDDGIHHEASLDYPFDSPIARLPSEILSQVFIQCLRPEPPVQTVLWWLHVCRPSNRDAPLLLCHICRGWRQVAMSTPQLWTAINFVRPYGKPRFPLKTLKDWIARSGSCGLSLVLGHSGRGNANISELMDIIVLPHARRWKDLSLTLPKPLLENLITAIGTGDGTPLLERLEIRTQSLDYSPVQEIDLLSAPRLTDVAIRGYLCLHLRNVAPNLRRVSLTRITMTFDSWNGWLDFLELSPALETLEIRYELDAPFHIRPRPPLTMLHLQTLGIHCYIYPNYFLDHLVLPTLHEVEISVNNHLHNPDSPTLSQLTSLLRRSKSPLESLKVETDATPSELIDCLRSAPDLRILRGDGSLSLDEVVDELTVRPNGVGCLCPQLEILEIWAHPESYLPLAAMVVSRYDADKTYPAAGRLRSIEFRMDNRFLVTDNAFQEFMEYPGIDACVKGGLSIITKR